MLDAKSTGDASFASRSVRLSSGAGSVCPERGGEGGTSGRGIYTVGFTGGLG